MRLFGKLLLIVGFVMAATSEGAQAAPDPENTLIMELRHGTVLIEMRPDLAPQHVARIKELTREKFFDRLKFHRVIFGFMAQTGDPDGDGTGGSGRKLDAEFSNEPFVRGTVGMARAGDPNKQDADDKEDPKFLNSADSQWFICFDDAQFLNGQYTVWGRVIEGMDVVDKIKKAPQGSRSGRVDNPDRIRTLRVLADVQ